MVIQEQKNRIIPYQMLYEAISGTHSLVENILPHHRDTTRLQTRIEAFMEMIK